MKARETSDDFNALLEYLRKNCGFDFAGYKRPSLTRRVRKRMDAVHVKNFVEYVDYLEVHPDEFEGLFNTILIIGGGRQVKRGELERPSRGHLGTAAL